MLSVSSWFLREELIARGFTVETFDNPLLLRAEKHGHFLYTHGSKTLTSASEFFICKQKYLAKQIMLRNGIATAHAELIHKSNPVLPPSLRVPLVLKPRDGEGGKDIVIGITTNEMVSSYFETHPHYDDVLAEELLLGQDTRILIIRGKFFAAVQRTPACVIGDGIHTIRQLVGLENNRRTVLKETDEQRQTYTTDLDLIVFDQTSTGVLQEQGKDEEMIPLLSERVFVRKNSNVSMGGTSVDVTEQVGEAIQRECERLASVLGMTTVGIDIMTTNLSQPLNVEKSSGVVEVNASPGLDLHILTDEGTRRNPVPLIVDEIEEFLTAQGK